MYIWSLNKAILHFASLVCDQSALVNWMRNWISEVYLEPCQLSMMELFRLSAADYISAFSCWLHFGFQLLTKSHHLFSSLPTNKFRRCTNQIFFSLVTHSRITPSDISKSPQVRFFIVDRASTTSLNICLRLNIPCTSSPPTSHIYSSSNQRHICSPAKHLLWVLFLRKWSAC